MQIHNILKWESDGCCRQTNRLKLICFEGAFQAFLSLILMTDLSSRFPDQLSLKKHSFYFFSFFLFLLWHLIKGMFLLLFSSLPFVFLLGVYKALPISMAKVRYAIQKMVRKINLASTTGAVRIISFDKYNVWWATAHSPT